jgi:mycothiol synthase
MTLTAIQQRAVTHDDVQAIVDLVNISEQATIGQQTMTVENALREWNSPEFNIAADTMAVFAPDGSALAHVEVHHPKEMPVRPFLWFTIHPEYLDAPFVDPLLAWGEQTARRVFDHVPDHARITLVTDTLVSDAESIAVLERNGFTGKDQIWERMIIRMEAEPEPFDLPAGVTIIPHSKFGDDYAVYLATRESFSDHRGHIDRDIKEGYKRWRYWHIESDKDYDSSVWFLAMVDGEVAGISLCKNKAEDSSDPAEAHVEILGVRKAYRRLGIAKALLRHSFRAFWERDKRAVSLWVDGSSLTGANWLYRRVGMVHDRGYRTYERILRDGEELSKQ